VAISCHEHGLNIAKQFGHECEAFHTLEGRDLFFCLSGLTSRPGIASATIRRALSLPSVSPAEIACGGAAVASPILGSVLVGVGAFGP
jgi:hypothetical protein